MSIWACGCSAFGSLHGDCDDVSGACVCRAGAQGRRCDHCSAGQTLTATGCVFDSHLLPSPITCDLLHCHFGATCHEGDGHATCLGCPHLCFPDIVVPPIGSQNTVALPHQQVEHSGCVVSSSSYSALYSVLSLIAGVTFQDHPQ
ncbi:Laminin EGF domain [Trinorchestia longiramus]|nr:Laminin EGF domain [Trinorchestia longiramus]